MIGSAVNVASRVEAQTRERDDDILLTGETRARLSDEFEVESRGEVELRGVGEPVAIYAPVAGAEPPEAEPAEAEEPLPTAGELARRLRPRRPRLLR